MQYQISREHVNALIKRLDLELVSALKTHLAEHVEVEILQSHKLGTGIIFAVQADNLRVEVMTAYIPITHRTAENVRVSMSGTKYLCARYQRAPRYDQWHLDLSFGERGYQAFGLPSIDDDSVEALAGMIAEHVLHQLSPLYA